MDIQLRKARVFRLAGKVQGAPPGSRIQVNLHPQMVGSGIQSFGFGGGGGLRPDGSFIIESVLPGSYDVLAMITGSGRPQIVGRTPVTVANANVENIIIQAGTPLDLTGRIIREGEGETALTGGQVLLQPAQSVPAFMSPAPIQDDGTFKISGVSRDKFLLNVFGLPPDLYVKSVMAGSVDVTRGVLDLSKSDTAPSLEIRVSSKGATVGGVVSDGDKPSPGAMVMLLPHPYVADQPALTRKTATTDQHGRFSIQGIAPGEYRLYAWESYIVGNQLDSEQLKPFEKFAATVKLKEEAREQVELKLAKIQPE
jgi:hypothetical protein